MTSLCQQEFQGQGTPTRWVWRELECMPSQIVVVDIDGTIADASHRQHYLNQTPKRWKGFMSACVDDTPISETVEWIDSLPEDVGVALQTGRWPQQKELTIQWLHEHRIRWDLLISRSYHDKYVPVVDYKTSGISELLEYGYEIMLVLDDDPKIIQALDDLQIPNKYIYSGYYDGK